ncbi:putative Ulp1 peptidase [Helianthus annuus]|nr:putative Ulp1 peptidase [Helianthus annuus]
MAEVIGSKRKNVLDDFNWKSLLDDDDSSDDRPPELIITKSKRENDVVDYTTKTNDELKDIISRHKGYLSSSTLRLKDNGDKLKATIRLCEAELQRRRNNNHKDGEDSTILLSDQSDDGASCRKDRSNQKSLASSTFGFMFSKKIDQDARTVNAFSEELSFFSPRQGRKTSQNGQLSNRGRSSQQSSSRSEQFRSPITLVDNRRHKVANSDKVNRSTTSIHRFYGTPAPQHQPSTKLKPKLPSSYNLVDEDIEEPYVSDTTLYAETLSDCMKDVEVHYPSRDDRNPVEVVYTDMECLAPEAYLSSTIMNFYIRYLQQSSSEDRTCNYHFFNTYFYNKLQNLNYTKDSFLKFRKWWKGVNIFEKAYIVLPVHESAHWSLGIICIPSKEDEIGPIVLHLDSLGGLHVSSSIFTTIRRFLTEEWNYLRNSEVSLDIPIMDEIWENLDHRIIDRKMQVPQQKNSYDCGLFVLYYIERFIKEAPERLTKKDISMFGKQWFLPEEASSLRVRINNLLVQEFKVAKEKESILSPKS